MYIFIIFIILLSNNVVMILRYQEHVYQRRTVRRKVMVVRNPRSQVHRYSDELSVLIDFIRVRQRIKPRYRHWLTLWSK